MLASSSPPPAPQDALEILSIDPLISPCPPLVSLQTPIRVAAQLMAHHGVHCVLVVDGGDAPGVGLYSDQAVLAAVATGIDTATTPIREAMVWSIPTLHRGDSLAVALGLLSCTTLPGLPVLDDQGQPCGFLCRQRLAETPWLQPEGASG